MSSAVTGWNRIQVVLFVVPSCLKPDNRMQDTVLGPVFASGFNLNNWVKFLIWWILGSFRQRRTARSSGQERRQGSGRSRRTTRSSRLPRSRRKWLGSTTPHWLSALFLQPFGGPVPSNDVHTPLDTRLSSLWHNQGCLPWNYVKLWSLAKVGHRASRASKSEDLRGRAEHWGKQENWRTKTGAEFKKIQSNFFS